MRLFRRAAAPSTPGFHLLLFLLTALTTTLVPFASPLGAFSDLPLGDAIRNPRFWSLGLSFSIPLLAILGIHELGHMVACRRYGLPATYPYFIPAPFGIGTLGAVIRIRAPITSRKALFDVGAAGPLAGFAVALPVVAWGVATSRVATTPAPPGQFEFSDPLLMKILERIVHPGLSAGADVVVSPLGLAGWFGLLVTALNLLPLSQLDGGHVLYAVAGRSQRRIGLVLFVVLVGLAFFWPGWILWAVIVLVMGIAHPPTAESSERLDGKRRALAFVCLIVFVLSFTPVPIRITKSETRSHPRPQPAKTYQL
ncbi:MAG TPA: site-2 protease family protein [Thermoanaerobaculia bacterium]|nr:site-2 protease family protein [Thermoanaerobaculia bacterium]